MNATQRTARPAGASTAGPHAAPARRLPPSPRGAASAVLRRSTLTSNSPGPQVLLTANDLTLDLSAQDNASSAWPPGPSRSRLQVLLTANGAVRLADVGFSRVKEKTFLSNGAGLLCCCAWAGEMALLVGACAGCALGLAHCGWSETASHDTTGRLPTAPADGLRAPDAHAPPPTPPRVAPLRRSAPGRHLCVDRAGDPAGQGGGGHLGRHLQVSVSRPLLVLRRWPLGGARSGVSAPPCPPPPARADPCACPPRAPPPPPFSYGVVLWEIVTGERPQRGSLASGGARGWGGVARVAGRAAGGRGTPADLAGRQTPRDSRDPPGSQPSADTPPCPATPPPPCSACPRSRRSAPRRCATW